MDKQNQIEVPLSRNGTSVLLPIEQGKALQIMLSSRNKWVKYPDLLDAGVRDPKAAIEALKGYGVVVEIIIKDTWSRNYDLFEDAPHYKYLHWCLDFTTADSNIAPKEGSQ